MKTGYAPHVEAILQQERDRPRDRLDEEIKIMSEIRTYNDTELIRTEFRELVEAVKPKPIRKFLGVYTK